MSNDSAKETMEFQTEVRQLLKLMIHSLYSNREIFLRELISNASDACDKLRFQALSDEGLYAGDSTLQIRLAYDKDAGTVTISDNGIGMNRQEVVDNIGTIAKSGTRKFFDSLTGDQSKDVNLIGQFGVGFYSAFIVADKVTLITRKAGEEGGQGVQWVSEGEGSYDIETVEKADRGTEITLHLREDSKDLLDGYRLRSIVGKYSDHIAIPILMYKEQTGGDEEDGAEKVIEEETINQASALWTRPKRDISDEEYTEFYKHVAHDYSTPMAHTHNHVEGNQSYTSLFYIPGKAPFDLFDREGSHGIKLYVKRIFIMDDTKELMPQYLRFIRGLVDSDDLPLNVSREILQSNKQIDTIRAASVKRVLTMIESLTKDDNAETYQKFWDEFGRVLKEGVSEDFNNQQRIAKLLRFSSTHTDSEAQTISLEDYVSRMKEEQKKIYYITAENFAAAKNSPHLEVFRKKNIEVLLMWDRVDEWMMSYLTEFDGKQFQSVAKGSLDLGELTDDDEKKELEEAEEGFKSLTERMKEVLGETVKEVRITHRLSRSPSCVVVEQNDMAVNMQQLLKAAGHDVPKVAPILEVNPTHPLVLKLKEEGDQKRFGDWTHILFDQAMLNEGVQLEDPSAFVQRLNDMLVTLG